MAIEDALDLYDSGRYREAFDMAMILGKAGHGSAYVLLGWIYEYGKIGTPNLDLALQNYQIAASTDRANGSYALGLFLRKQGQLHAAFDCFSTAAKEGSIPGAYNAGLCCATGTGTSLNEMRGHRYYECAARAGHVFARAKLARRDIKSRNPFKVIRGIFGFILSILHMVIIVSKNKYDERILE